MVLDDDFIQTVELKSFTLIKKGFRMGTDMDLTLIQITRKSRPEISRDFWPEASIEIPIERKKTFQ